MCITEKPSVAKDIAAILKATTRRDGYYEGGEWCVTWTYGHLCCLKDPGDYSPSWQHWTLSALPMIPQRFGIKVINEKIIKQQFAVIKKLIAQADEVINCGDAGQEERAADESAGSAHQFHGVDDKSARINGQTNGVVD